MKTKKRNQVLFAAIGLSAVLLLFLLLVPNKIRLRSGSPKVEFVTEAGLVTAVNVSGPFPYGLMELDPEESLLRDTSGNMTEKVVTYTMEAGFSLSRQISMKIDIETSDSVTCTYILKFADRDVTIKNGRVAE